MRVRAVRAAPLSIPTATTVRASVDTLGGDADASSGDLERAAAISADGTWAAFVSNATDLVNGDGNGKVDAFARDLTNGVTVRVSVDAGGGDADGDASGVSISGDGSRVAFGSYADDLVAGDTKGHGDIFVRDLNAGTTTRVSLGAGGVEPNADCQSPAISDGQWVVFDSAASNLVPGDTDGTWDVFLANLNTGKLVRVSSVIGVVNNLTSVTAGIAIADGNGQGTIRNDD